MTQKLWAIKLRHWPWLNSSPLEAKNPGIFHGLATTFQPFVMHIESSLQIEDAFRGIAILSLSIAMEYICMCPGHVYRTCIHMYRL